MSDFKELKTIIDEIEEDDGVILFVFKKDKISQLRAFHNVNKYQMSGCSKILDVFVDIKIIEELKQ